MKAEISQIIDKAERSLKTAKEIFKSEEYDFAVSRAYYTIFYMAEAVLMTKGLSYSKHSGVIAAFGQQLIKTGVLDKKMHTILKNAFKRRNIGDYEFNITITKEEAERVINDAEEFFQTVRDYLEKNL
jgi:uncharacterized protein (UPF0332 family)